MATNRTVEAKKKQERLRVCRRRIDELERLICKIYEDNALGKMPESRYETLVGQYSKEQASLKSETDQIVFFLADIEAKGRNSFDYLIIRYPALTDILLSVIISNKIWNDGIQMIQE